MTVSPALGATREVALPSGTLRYRERGEGRPIVLLHGLIINGDLWRHVVPSLSERYRCIVPDLPWGAHELAMPPDTELTMATIGRMAGELLDALDLRDVVIVGSGGGTGAAQHVIGGGGERVAGAVLLAGDTVFGFPPTSAWPAIGLSLVPGLLSLAIIGLRSELARRVLLAYLAKRDPDRVMLESYTGPMRTDADIRRDLVKFVRGIRRHHLRNLDLGAFGGPAVVAWGRGDLMFREQHMLALADALPGARYEALDECRTLVPEDRPERVVALVDEVAGRLAGGARRAA